MHINLFYLVYSDPTLSKGLPKENQNNKSTFGGFFTGFKTIFSGSRDTDESPVPIHSPQTIQNQEIYETPQVFTQNNPLAPPKPDNNFKVGGTVADNIKVSEAKEDTKPHLDHALPNMNPNNQQRVNVPPKVR